MGIKSWVEKRFTEVKESGDERVRKAEEGRFFGSDQYSRYLSNITGATKVARVIRGQKNGGYKNYGVDDYKDDTRTMRPTIGYSAATHAVEDATIAEAKAEQERVAYQNSVIQAANDRAARLSRDVRIRRRAGDANRPGNKNGTLLTGALGLLSGTSSTLG